MGRGGGLLVETLETIRGGVVGVGGKLLVAAEGIERALMLQPHVSEIRLKTSSGKTYDLKSAGSTGPRSVFAAARSRRSSAA